MLPRDISQQIINELVYSGCLTDVSFEGFRDCALQVTLIRNAGNHISNSLLKKSVRAVLFIFVVSVMLTLEVSFIFFFNWKDLYLGECPDVNDSWMDVISSQGSSLLSLDLSGSDVTDDGLIYLQDCKSLQALNFNDCDHISDHGLEHISGSPS